jgi:hypothetical protein
MDKGGEKPHRCNKTLKQTRWEHCKVLVAEPFECQALWSTNFAGVHFLVRPSMTHSILIKPALQGSVSVSGRSA